MVIQEWVSKLTFMQQSVLLTAIRGPDGLKKDHVSKLLIRWLRRCILYSAFESRLAGKPFAFSDPATPGGGSFTGPSVPLGEDWQTAMNAVVDDYLSHLDEVPHHFQLHFMHAAEIIGYCHPAEAIGNWWCGLYRRLAADMHLNPETVEQMMKRLGDVREDWLTAEQVIARGP